MKVITRDDKKHKFRKIEKIGSVYYGSIKINGEITKIPLQQNEIKSLRQVDKTTSTILTVGTILVSAGAIVIVIGIITFDYNPDSNDPIL
ncbi:hypothetical protein Q767_12400 [Flavobacterium enshiense DK69]|uniref:Uncharacterized protein n=2 Tax=Flavobacterium TaxID=237 RepID=A0A0A2N4B0_9FLAO|nr:hypothetical protein Q767_12400 [Flavobacterium enshiense DK69]